PGSAANHLSFTGLPAAAHIVVITNTTGFPALYDLRPGGGCGVTPSPTPTATATPTCPAGAPRGPAAWIAASPYPLNIVRYGFAQTATHFYVFGGVADGNRVNNVNRYDLPTGTVQSPA